MYYSGSQKPDGLNKLLIANRGEIAIRIIMTCRRLSIRTVAVYSEIDREADHVSLADEGICIGPPEASQSYLDGAKIIEAAIRTGADAIHPGYGFLSENADFADAVRAAGLIFVGPHSDAIRTMGSKTEARKLAAKLGVPLVPGYDGDDQSPEHLAKQAQEIGFPVMIKAVAGGGGKGIRVVEDPKTFTSDLKAAVQEAERAFGNGHVILERYIPRPRHVEVQVMGDQHGNLIHLYTRDCSIQRRFQKLIEEAPAPNLSDAVRDGLHECALKLAREIGYDNAGTVEFLYDPETEAYYFLEMNTRLQVEHPVTEEVTDTDLVELQLRAAAGEALGIAQEDLVIEGSSIEVRINAEIPEENFRPDTGTIDLLDEYASGISAYLRVETGITSGSVVSPYYDSLLMKVISCAATRDEARSELTNFLDGMLLTGVRTNRDFVKALLESDSFQATELTTHFIEDNLPDWRPIDGDDPEPLVIAAITIVQSIEQVLKDSNQPTPWQTLGPWRLLGNAGYAGQTCVLLAHAEERIEIRVRGRTDDYEVQIDDRTYSVSVLNPPLLASDIPDTPGAIRCEIDGHTLDWHVRLFKGSAWVKGKGQTRVYRILPPEEQYVRVAEETSNGQTTLTAPYPGLITEVHVKPGDQVAVGDHLVVMEAMKMIQHLSAVGDGTIKAVHCRPEQSVNTGDLLVEFEEESS